MLDRRHFLSTCSGFGLGATLFPVTLLALAEDKPAVTIDMIDKAAAIAGVAIPEDDRQMMLDSLNDRVKGYNDIFALQIANSVPPAFVFDPVLP